MPTDAPTAPPPAAAPAAAKPTAAELAARTTINVSTLPTDTVPTKPPKPGSARARMYEALNKKFGGDDNTEAPRAASSKTAPPPAAPAAEEAPTTKAGGEPGDQSPPGSSPPAEPPAAPAPGEAPATGKKLSPWKLVDQFKERATKAEARLLEVEKQIIPEEQRKANEAQLEEMRAKIKEMSEELRFVHAEKYDPDVIKARTEYERAFNRAMTDLKTISIKDPATDQMRPLTVNDLAELAFMDLGQAVTVAKEVFGDLAPMVMDYRNEIRRHWDTQEAVKKQLKQTGAQREQERLEAAKRTSQTLNEEIQKHYHQANESILSDAKHGLFFKPHAGDEEWNKQLDSGLKFVDEALAGNAFDPKLTAEQRAEIVRKHAALRSMAAGWRPLRYRLRVLEKQLAEANEELKQYKATSPTTGGRTTPPPPEKRRGMAGLMDELQKIAH